MGSMVGSIVGCVVGSVVGADVGGSSHIVFPAGSQAPVLISLSGAQLYCQFPGIPQFMVELAPHDKLP